INLPTQIIIALVLGIILGSILHGNKDVINYIQPFGDVFINLIKMLVVPIVFCSLALSISNVGDTKTIGRYGGKTLLYFVIMTSFAIFMGLIFGNLFKPGVGLNPDLHPKGDISKYESTANAAEQSTYGNHLIDTIVNIIPTNI
ncbi:glutamate:protein symporter, partial [Staphylococcus warneri]